MTDPFYLILIHSITPPGGESEGTNSGTEATLHISCRYNWAIVVRLLFLASIHMP